ncbi:tyrosine-type recombinase/integrase [soil metagenome]
MKRDLPARVYRKHGAFYFVDMDRRWHRLCAIKEGIPNMYRALATLTEKEARSDRMPAVITRWLDEKRPDWGVAMKRNMERMADVMSHRLVEYTPADMKTPDVKSFLADYAKQPRTHNLYRAMLRQVLAYAAGEGLREGWNPVDDLKGKSTPGRKRIVTDAEIARIKAAALMADGKPVRNGQALVQMIDLALITGQRISDLIKIRWQDVTKTHLFVEQGKTGVRIEVELSPALKRALNACSKGRDKIGFVLKTQSGSGYKYAGIRSAWVRACERAKVADLNIHDMRGRAGVDKVAMHGKEEAQKLLGHRNMRTTEHYVEGKTTVRVSPAK